MKKTLSILLTVILAALCTLSSFASDAVSKESVLKEIDSTVAYITDEISGYTVDSAADYYYIAKTGTKLNTFYDAFLQNVKDNLEENSGKLVTEYGENITTYAAVIGIIDTMGGDPANINSVNLVELFENCDISTVSNPYYYNIVIPVAAKHCGEQFVKSLCDSFIDEYYVEGSGVDYWGFSCDSTAMFISAVSQSGLEAYDDILEDAAKVLNTYETEGGYYYNSQYGVEPNVSSTALALMAKSEYYAHTCTVEDNITELYGLFKSLLTYKGETEGSYAYDGVESAFSTADALKGLMSFYSVMPDNGSLDNTDVTDNKEPESEPSTKAPADNETDKNPDIPNTDSGNSVISVGVASLAVILAAVALNKKKENID